MRLLFIQVAFPQTAEYSSHRTLAEHVDPRQLDCYFVWQDNTHDRSLNVPARGRDFFLDFGRNMDLEPRPSKARRAVMMATSFPRGYLYLHRLMQRIRPDAVYTSQQQYDVYFGRTLSRRFGVPHIIHVHYPFGPWLGKSTSETIAECPRLIAASEFIRQGLIEAGVSPEHVRTRHEVVPLERFDRPRQRGPIREEFGWPDETPLVVAAGRLDPSKGHLLLFEAFATVVESVPGARLLVCGVTTQPGYDAVLERRVAALGLQEHVVFAGSRSDMPAIYAAADVFSLPTENDACPMVFLEAMTAGLPAVAIASGGVPEMVVDGETGLLSAPDDAPALANNLLAVLRDPPLAARFGEAGKLRAASTFAPAKAAAHWTELLRQFVPERD
jgi:glycosyltransferase involved in cell wall biosynthesis